MSDCPDAAARAHFTPSPRFVIATETEQSSPVAHLVGDVGEVTARHGMALCGLPAEVLVIVPGLQWEQVDPASRCEPCQERLPESP